MLGAKILLILVPILLVEAQNHSPWRPNTARRLPFFKPGGRHGPFTAVTSVPVEPITTEKIEIVSEESPVTPPKNNGIISISSDIITPSIKPTKLTIVYPEKYKPVSTASPPVQFFRGRRPVRRPLFRPRPTIGSSVIVPTTPPPPKPTESVTVNVVTSAPPSTELVVIQSTEKQPEIIVIPVSTEPPFSKEPILITAISKEPASEAPIFEVSISDEPISEVPIKEEPITEEPISVQPPPQPTIVEPSISRPLNSHIIPPITIRVPSTTQRPITTQSRITTSHLAPATQKPVENVHTTLVITQRPPISKSPISVPIYIESVTSIGDHINPSMDIIKPPVSSESNSVVIGGNKPSRQPAVIWHPVQQKPRTTLVPTVTEVYSPTITQKPKGPNGTGWSKPIDNTFAVNRLHDYVCKTMDGYELVLNKCDIYIECKSHLAFQNTCPDGLHFNPAAQWPEYPCGYPSDVQCQRQDVTREECSSSEQAARSPPASWEIQQAAHCGEKTSNTTICEGSYRQDWQYVKESFKKPQASDQCPHRYGFYPMPGSDCGQYIMCQEGLATVMSCPPGLAFSPITSSCDWPANVPGCIPLIFREYTCPPSAVDENGQETNDSKFRYENGCQQYIACHEGSPRLLSCDAGMSFDEQSETCVDADQVMDCQQ